jgi:hypothetical protein
LDDRAVHLLFSANRWEASDDICRLLASGRVVVCDRYAYSGVAFSSAKGLDIDWCKAPDQGLPAPDCVIFLDISQDDAERRGGYGTVCYVEGCQGVDSHLSTRVIIHLTRVLNYLRLLTSFVTRAGTGTSATKRERCRQRSGTSSKSFVRWKGARSGRW